MDERYKKRWMTVALLAATIAVISQIPAEALAQADPIRTAQGGSPQAQSEKMEKALLIVTTDYFIGPEDVLTITVWRNVDLSREVTVRPDGKISLPLIGDITAVGRTPSQLSGWKSHKPNPINVRTTRSTLCENMPTHASG